MISLPAGMRIGIVAGVTDMRRGFIGLAAMVQTALQENPFSDSVSHQESEEPRRTCRRTSGYQLAFVVLFRLRRKS